MSAARWLLLAGALALIATLQPRLASRAHGIKAQEDVYVLPPPKQLRAATLGYRSAAADMLWAKLLVEYGIHIADKREFPDLTKYMDAVLILEPDYAPLYRFCDTLIVFHYPRGTEEDVRVARRYLERGLRERPQDHRMWLQYGQFVAFLGPSFLGADSEKERWRKEGAEAILRAVELGADADRALSAASILSRAGEKKAVLAQLERAYALTDDPETRAQIELKMQRLRESPDPETIKGDMTFVEGAWRSDFSFMKRGEFLQIAPIVDPLACAGPSATSRPTCRRSWEERLPSHTP
jgi:hypothetical protein